MEDLCIKFANIVTVSTFKNTLKHRKWNFNSICCMEKNSQAPGKTTFSIKPCWTAQNYRNFVVFSSPPFHTPVKQQSIQLSTQYFPRQLWLCRSGNVGPLFCMENIFTMICLTMYIIDIDKLVYFWKVFSWFGGKLSFFKWKFRLILIFLGDLRVEELRNGLIEGKEGFSAGQEVPCGTCFFY